MTEVKVPDIGDFDDVPIIEILVKVGDTVSAEDPLVTLESDKATMDVPAPYDGVVKEILVSIGDTVPSNLAAAQGTYPFWVEAQYVNNAGNTGADSTAVNAIISALQNQATTAAIADVDAIPDVVGAAGGNYNTTVHYNAFNSGVLPTGGGSAKVYVNTSTRAGVTCHAPQYAATAP